MSSTPNSVMRHATSSPTGSLQAPPDNLRQLRDRQLRPPLPPEVTNFEPPEGVELDRNRLISNPRSARRGLRPALSGARNEHLKAVLEDEATTEHLTDIAQHLVQANVPECIQQAMRLSRLTAMKKPKAKSRGSTPEILSDDSWLRR